MEQKEQAYVVVTKALDDEAERIELPVDADGTLCIQTLVGAFPDAHGLKYKNPATGAFRALSIDPTGTKFSAPPDSWENKVFIVLCKQQELQTAATKSQSKKGDQNAKRRKLMVESDDGGGDSQSDSEQQQRRSSMANEEKWRSGGQRQTGGAASKQKRMMGVGGGVYAASFGGNDLHGGGGDFVSIKNEDKEEVGGAEEGAADAPPPNKIVDLLVLGLPFELNDTELRAHFEAFGKVVHCEIKAQKGQTTNRGFGFVQMADLEAQRAVLDQKPHFIGGRECIVKVPFSKNALSSKVFVGRIKEGTTTMELRNFFTEEARKIEEEASITDVYIPRPFRSFAFVSFSSPVVAKELIKIGQFTMGETAIYVSSAHSTRPQDAVHNTNQYQQQNRGYQHVQASNSSPQDFYNEWYSSTRGGGEGLSSGSTQTQQAAITLYPSHHQNTAAPTFTAYHHQQHQTNAAHTQQHQIPVYMASNNQTTGGAPTTVAAGSQMLNQLETLNLNTMGIGHEVVNAIKAIFSVAQNAAVSVNTANVPPQHPQQKVAAIQSVVVPPHNQQQQTPGMGGGGYSIYNQTLSPPPPPTLQTSSQQSVGRYIPPHLQQQQKGRRNAGNGMGNGGAAGGVWR